MNQKEVFIKEFKKVYCQKVTQVNNELKKMYKIYKTGVMNNDTNKKDRARSIIKPAKEIKIPTGQFVYKNERTEISGNINDKDVKNIAYREQNFRYGYKYLILFAVVVLAIIFREKILLLIPTYFVTQAGSIIQSLFKNWKSQ